MKQVITVADVEAARGPVSVGPGDLVTPLALDRARELGVQIVFGERAGGAAPAAKAPAAPSLAPPPQSATAASPSGALFRRGAPLAPKYTAVADQRAGDSRPHAAVIGAGHVGSMTALRLAECNEFARITLVDVVPGLAAGLALDMTHAASLRKFTTRVEGSTEMAALAGTQFIVVTAGRARQPGMSRTDLTAANAGIIRGVAAGIRQHAPDAIVVVVTNPLEEMTHLMTRETGFAPERVIGMAGVLDTARFRSLVGLTGVAEPAQVRAVALGSHGPEMVIPLSQASANGRPLEELLAPDVLAAIVERARDSGAEVVKLLQKGSAYFAPAESAAAMVRAMAGNTNEALPCCVMPRGAYGLVDARIGLPVRLNRSGAGEIVALDLRPAELAALRKAAESIAARIRELG